MEQLRHARVVRIQNRQLPCDARLIVHRNTGLSPCTLCQPNTMVSADEGMHKLADLGLVKF